MRCSGFHLCIIRNSDILDPRCVRSPKLTLDAEPFSTNLPLQAQKRTLPYLYVHIFSQPPDPATVRPQGVLEEAMAKIASQWGKGGMDYVYACSQLKAIRQDLVVRQNSCSWSRMVHPLTIIWWRSFVNVPWHTLEYSNLLLQVQRIKNTFTVEVYEGHARIALEQVSKITRTILQVTVTRYSILLSFASHSENQFCTKY